MLLLLQAVTSLLAVQPDTIRPVHDALHYDVTLVVGDTGSQVVGQVETVWRLGAAEPVRAQLDTALRVVEAQAGDGSGTRGSRPTWQRQGQWVVVPHERRPGDTVRTRIRYQGAPRDGLVITETGGTRTVFADNWPDRAHFWLPSNDHPSDKATASFHVEVPAGHRAIANGRLERVDTLAGGRTVWHYRIARPIPVYTMVVGVARFAVTRLPQAACEVTCVPLEVWTYPPDSAYAVSGPFRRAGDMLAYLSRLIGPYPYGSLAHVQSTTRFGGMENTTAVFYDGKAYAARNLSETVVAHETAHQWFGDAVTERDWHHLWLSEGFATYLAALWRGHADGDSAFAAEMRSAAEAVRTGEATSRPVVDPEARDLMALLNTNNYQKGAWVLHQLRGLVGDSAFVRGLRQFYARYRDSTALSADFARVMSEAAGRDLEWYFRQALTQPGYPQLEVTWRHAGDRLTLDIRQTQPEAWGVYRLPGLTVRVDGRDYRVDVDGRTTRRVLTGVGRRPTAVTIDPEGWWLLTSTVSAGQ